MLHAGIEPLWVCEGAFDALALVAAGVRRVVAIFGVQGWRWDWAREVRELVFALDRRCRRAAAVAPARPPGGAAGEAGGGAGAGGVWGAQRRQCCLDGGGTSGGQKPLDGGTTSNAWRVLPGFYGLSALLTVL